jgi:hypothetical protein
LNRFDFSGPPLSCCYHYPMTNINQRMLGRIPETYDVRKVLEALIQELVKEDILHRSQVDFIIEKGKPKSQESIEQKY